MKINLLEALVQVPDFRAPRGRRYPLWLILLLVIMGTMSDCLGYQALEDFARRHQEALVESLKLPPMRTTAVRMIAHNLERIFLLLAKVVPEAFSSAQ